MRGIRPKISVRMLMLAVLVIGVLSAAVASWMKRRQEDSMWRAAWYADLAQERRAIAEVSTPRVAQRLRRKVEEYESTSRAYRRSASRPWLRSPADPHPPPADW